MIHHVVRFFAEHWLTIWFAASLAVTFFICAAGAISDEPASRDSKPQLLTPNS